MNRFEETLPERAKGIKFFLDWFMSNSYNYNFHDINLDRKLYEGYVEYWKSLGESSN